MKTPPVLKLVFGAGGVEQRAVRGVSGLEAKLMIKKAQRTCSCLVALICFL